MKAIHYGIIGGILGASITVTFILVLPIFSNPITNSIANTGFNNKANCKTLGDQIEDLYKQGVDLEAQMPVGIAGMSEMEAKELLKKEREYATKIAPLRTEFLRKLTEYKDLGCDFSRFLDHMTDQRGMPLDEETKNRLRQNPP